MKPKETMQSSKIQLDLQTDIFEKLRFNRSYPPLTDNTRSFYENFIKQKCLREVDITGFKDIGKNYTLIGQEHKNLPILQDVIFNRFSNDTKTKRQVELKKKFKEKKVDSLLIATHVPVTSNPQYTKPKENETFLIEAAHEKRVLELLQQIQTQPENRRANLKLIAELIAESPPIVNQEFIIHLMRGSKQGKTGEFKGLIILCSRLSESPDGVKGKIEHNQCKQNLEILNELMECEKNPSYELFLKEYQEMPIAQLGTLHLDQHILCDKACKIQALKLFSKYIEGLKRVYGSNDWREILKKQKMLMSLNNNLLIDIFMFVLKKRFKKQVYEELEGFMEGKQLVLKKIMSNSVAQKPEIVSRGKMTQSSMLNFSYLDSEIEDKPARKLGNLKEVLKDKFIKWNTVYDIPEKQITLSHAFPACDFVKLTVRLPLSAPECFQLLIHQRNVWDSLLMASKRTQNKCQDEGDIKHIENSNGLKIVDTYSWNFSKKIRFYLEQKIEVDDECRLISILRSPFEPSVASSQALDDIDLKNSSDCSVGKWENLIQIREVGYSQNISAEKKQVNSSKEIENNYNYQKEISSSPSKGIITPTKPQTIPQIANKSGYISCTSETPSASKDSFICEQAEFLLEDDQDDGCIERKKIKSYYQPKKQEEKELEESKKESENAIESDSRGEPGEQGSISNSQGRDTPFSNSSYSSITYSLDPCSAGGYFKRNSQKNKSDNIKPLALPIFRKLNSDSELGNSKNIVDNYSCPNTGHRFSLRQLSAAKKNSEDSQHTDFDNSIIIDPFEMQEPSSEQKQSQKLNLKLLAPQQAKPNSLCESDITFLFNLLNSESVHFFSKFIVKHDDDTLIQNMTRLIEIAKKIRKESSSTADSTRLVTSNRKESNQSEPSNTSEYSLSQGTYSTDN